jgi:hypothetical protein
MEAKRWEEMRRQDEERTEKLGMNIQINEGREKGFKNKGRKG